MIIRKSSWISLDGQKLLNLRKQRVMRYVKSYLDLFKHNTVIYEKEFL